MTTANLSLWNRMKLRNKFWAVSSGFTLVLVALIGFNVKAIESQKQTSQISDLAGRQRMLSQRFIKEIILSGVGVQAEHETSAKVMRETLAVLTDGGSAVINLQAGTRAEVPPAPTADIRAKLGEQAQLLRQLEAEGTRFLALPANDPRRGDKLKELNVLQIQLNEVADAVLKMFTRHSEERIDAIVFWQIVGGVLSAIIGIMMSWLISRDIAGPLESIAEASRQIADGNLRIPHQRVTSTDELGAMQVAFNDMLDSLRDISGQTRSACDSLTLAAAQILASAQEQAASTRQQAAAVQEITTTVEEISVSGKQVAERARQVAGTAETVATSGAAGLQAVHDASVGMEAIREQTETVAENIITLSERTQAVGEIIATVNDIAEQSNLVALNAAIEAADAREQGRRFSVVANEIKNLADQAKEATGQVRGILEQTQKGINTSVMLTEEALKRVETGRDRTAVSEQTIRQMAGNIQDSLHAFQQIVGATNQQQIGLEQVTQALHEIRQASQQTALTTAQLEKASLDLSLLGQQLAHTLEKYRL
ncbi:MAG: methyl-accepting chemotaxis protein [Magnetospirillum sp.]|nr:methyl-accepting chemotaxis protein [Magnetospirillum sp.]